MEYSSLFDKLDSLTDLEAALLLCFISREHCIIETDRSAIDDVENELILVSVNVFGLSYAALNCSHDTTLEEFSNAILCPKIGISEHTDGQPKFPSSQESGFSRDKSKSRLRVNYLDDRKVVNVIIAKDFDQTPEEIQIQALELLRSKRIFTRTAVHIVPKVFLFIPLVSTGNRVLSSLLNKHLNDHIFISHYHNPQNGYANLEDDSGWLSDDQGSMSSVIRKSAPGLRKTLTEGTIVTKEVLLSHSDIDYLRNLSNNVTFSAEVTSFLQNIIAFLRLNRGVAGGISAAATSHFYLLARCLAPLHQVDYVFPSLVEVAARKIYRHRIVVATPEDDRSLLYGSDLDAIGLFLAEVSAENIIEDVIAEVEAPL